MRILISARSKINRTAADVEVDKADAYLMNVAQALRDEILQSFREPKHGRVYRLSRVKKSKLHVASAPGEPPAVMTGALSRSIVADRAGRLVWAVGAGSGTAEKYARRLEFGDGKLAPRPYMRPAARKVAQQYGVRFRVV